MRGAIARRPGVVVNARAGSVQREPELIERLALLVPPERLEVTREPADVRPALEALREAAVDAVAVVGGDGSVTCTLTELAEVWGAEPSLPAVALLAGGSVNTLPRALGGSGAPDEALARLVRSPERARVRALHVLRVRDASGNARCGLIFGNGAVARWLEHYYTQPRRGRLGAALGVAQVLRSIAAGGRLARALLAPFDAKVEIDGEPAPLERLTATAAGGIPDIGLGFRPFHSAGSVPGRFDFIFTDAGPLQMGLEFAGVALRVHSPLSRLRHACAAHVAIRTTESLPYTVDGDLFPRTTSLEVSSGPEIHFLAP